MVERKALELVWGTAVFQHFRYITAATYPESYPLG